MENSYQTKTIHTNKYYRNLLLLLIAQVTQRLSYQEIANSLAAQNILTQTGKLYSANTVKKNLKKQKNPAYYPFKRYQKMLELCSQGDLSATDCNTLFQRYRGEM